MNVKVVTAVIVSSCLVSMLFAGMTESIQAPFYPLEATKKGLGSSLYGLVFGMYQVCNIIAAVILGKYENKIGYKFMTVTALLLLGSCAISFGFLSHIQSTTAFFICSLLIRSFEGMGNAAINIGIITFLTLQYPEKAARNIGYSESFSSVGMSLGPIIGGVLFDFCGFTGPFVVVGGSILLITPLIMILMKNNLGGSSEQQEKETQSSILTLLKIPNMWIAIVTTMLFTTNRHFINTTLAEYLEVLQLSGSALGAVFSAMIVMYILFTPVFGWILDKHHLSPRVCIIIGTCVFCFSYSLLGPLSFYTGPALPVVIPSLMCIGAAWAAQMTATLMLMKETSWSSGVENNRAYNGLITGMWISLLHLGAFMGNVIGGIIFQNLGFNVSSGILMLTNGLVCLTHIGIYLYTWHQSHKLTEIENAEPPQCNPHNVVHNEEMNPPIPPTSNA